MSGDGDLQVSLGKPLQLLVGRASWCLVGRRDVFVVGDRRLLSAHGYIQIQIMVRCVIGLGGCISLHIYALIFGMIGALLIPVRGISWDAL